MGDPTRQLLELLQEWRRLTEAEGQAILGGRWVQLSQHQAAKGRLQPQITLATDAFRARQRAGEPPDPLAPSLARLVESLFALEHANKEALDGKRRGNRAKFAQTECVTRNVRSIQRAYGASPAPGWATYS